ncbi:hypothetical protein DSO57_1039408 [Entomophthora muscae]|uniref:Uncharacterized protein n=1 Tax=Entomophthora muscae TaxID=34485 RepID=A0ACC2RPD2_9FUNG|nr:hypothetical protein DSO57_1039408 [Entomophthora muscae]
MLGGGVAERTFSAEVACIGGVLQGLDDAEEMERSCGMASAGIFFIMQSASLDMFFDMVVHRRRGAELVRLRVLLASILCIKVFELGKTLSGAGVERFSGRQFRGL